MPSEPTTLLKKLTLGCVALALWAGGPAVADEQKDAAKDAAAADDQGAKETVLFDGQSLDGWKTTKFGGEGEPRVEEGEMILPAGALLSGVNYVGKAELPKVNYEIALEARRRQGGDFFCGLTFPVKDSHASLILGGWGGGLTGISSLDGMDASENETSKLMKFKKNQWYKVRVRVLEDRIQAWVDDEQIVDANTKGRKVSTRIEVRASRPLGIATYQTEGGIKNVRLRPLTAEEVKAAAGGGEAGGTAEGTAGAEKTEKSE